MVESVWSFWSPLKESNPQHSEYRTDTLPIELRRLFKMVEFRITSTTTDRYIYDKIDLSFYTNIYKKMLKTKYLAMFFMLFEFNFLL